MCGRDRCVLKQKDTRKEERKDDSAPGRGPYESVGMQLCHCMEPRMEKDWRTIIVDDINLISTLTNRDCLTAATHPHRIVTQRSSSQSLD